MVVCTFAFLTTSSRVKKARVVRLLVSTRPKAASAVLVQCRFGAALQRCVNFTADTTLDLCCAGAVSLWCCAVEMREFYRGALLSISAVLEQCRFGAVLKKCGNFTAERYSRSLLCWSSVALVLR